MSADFDCIILFRAIRNKKDGSDMQNRFSEEPQAAKKWIIPAIRGAHAAYNIYKYVTIKYILFRERCIFYMF